MSEKNVDRKAVIEAMQDAVNMQRCTRYQRMLQKDSQSFAEIRLLSYLQAYGNTEESHLVACGIHRLNKPEEDVRRILEEMSSKGTILKVIHKELEPQKVYFALDPDLDWDLHVLVSIDADGNSDKFRQSIEKEIVSAS